MKHVILLLSRKYYRDLGTLYLDEMNHKSGFFICYSNPNFKIGFWNWVENEDLFCSLYDLYIRMSTLKPR